MKKKTKISYKQKRLIFVGSVALMSLMAIAFALNSFRNNIVFFYSPSELHKISSIKRQIRVGGMIKKDSLIKIDALNTEFVITDFEQDLKIKYRGLLPDLFREGQGVVAKGFLSSNHAEFLTEELLVKHDENYMPPEVAKSLKRQMSK